ncbi:3'-5' exonuclease [Antarcticibacterium arcticum]|uniref:3'-5' exonuclease n=1 Tax=Antarcticibacterium arcticum TaxID=2585771 RepID=A0A5B8YNE5_9FLAO|nr:3'-5' exonuclease [Antarcticibacterium arcticum]QED38367.1 3'-5' exonuclease [Antarcticibacterium arcticum]
MIRKLNLEHILFLDIETVPEEKNFNDLTEEKKKLWEEKSKYQRKEDFTPEEFYDRAGIWAEFGKIICISVGFFKFKNGVRTFRVTTFKGAEEKILLDFSELLESHFYKPHHLLCAHNGKEFDFPYIARRCMIHNLPLPGKLDLFGKKPWEVPHLDTLELWKFGDYKHYTSLKLLTNVLGIPSPKEDIDGSEVRDVFYIDHGIGRIVNYCEKDVVAIAQVILKLRQESLLEESEIITV